MAFNGTWEIESVDNKAGLASLMKEEFGDNAPTPDQKPKISITQDGDAFTIVFPGRPAISYSIGQPFETEMQSKKLTGLANWDGDKMVTNTVFDGRKKMKTTRRVEGDHLHQTLEGEDGTTVNMVFKKV